MNPHLTCQVQTCHSTSNIPHYTQSLFTDIPISSAISPAVSEWLRVTESERHCKLSLSVSDPLQRDANQVHLPATQRLLAAHHASEQRGRSLQLPRYRHAVTNYHVCGVAIFFTARVSGNVWSASDKLMGRQVETQEGRDRWNIVSSSEGIVILHICKYHHLLYLSHSVSLFFFQCKQKLNDITVYTKP